MNRSSHRFRRGSVYIAVLAVSVMVITIALGAILAVRVQARSVDTLNDAADARLYALSAIELGRLWISQDSNWRSNRPSGAWVTNQSIGRGTLTLEAFDPVDGNIPSGLRDPLVLRGTGVKGQARQKLQVTLNAKPVPLPALRYALHTGGQLRVLSGKQLIAAGATVSTNGSLRNDGIIVGNVEAGTAVNVGIISGTVTLGAPPKAFPDPGVPEMYAAKGTLINPGNTIDKQVLSHGRNPWGATNPNGVYVIRTTSDLTIRNTRIYGTLVVICPGRKVTLDAQVLLQPYRPDYPVLIVNGNAVFQYTSAGTPLSEAALSTNFNPSGAPYQGSSDTDLTDQYPSEIQGLVHVTGTLSFPQSGVIRGAVICESTALADAVDCAGVTEIVYDPNLYANPPEGYTVAVKMLVQPGSWQQCVD